LTIAKLRAFLLASLGFALAVAPRLEADIVSFPISSDFDAEFARAVDLLETGNRAQAEQVLGQILTRSGQPAWKARVEMLFAADDERRGDFGSAVGHLARAPAVAIGLEPYRRLRLGYALAKQGRLGDAEREIAGAFETDEPFAMRSGAGRELARLLEKQRRRAEALRVLARVAPVAPAQEAAAVGAERVRLARSVGDAQAERSAARDLVAAGIDAPDFPPARQAVARELSRGTPAERARFARARIAAGDIRRGVKLLKADPPAQWPPEERGANLLALARGLQRLGDAHGAERVAQAIPQDGTEASYDSRLLRADLALARLHKRGSPAVPPDDPVLLAVRQTLLDLVSAGAPASVRAAARERLIRIAVEREHFDQGLDQARQLLQETPETTAGFEPLWKLAWKTYLDGDFAAARGQFAALSPLYSWISVKRRLAYWMARCLEREGRGVEAAPVFRELASSDPADLYALFARRRVERYQAQKLPPVSDPSTATATFRKTDELLRLRLFVEAAAEARALPRSRGRDRRLAQAEFALGHFPVAAAAARRAFPEIGTAGEGGVPDPWRRLYYPIEVGGFLSDRAREFGLDPAVLRGLVRQESVFEARARSKAGALGLTQLMPATAKSLSRSVLRQRYRKAFLYDPRINAHLGAAYLRRLLDRFGGNATYALAAYNGGPTRMARLIRENGGRPEDEIFESHPAYETRDYVRRVLLFAESYRELYGEGKSDK
jgi:soluble lytic murein transglycosylase-like protein